MTTSNNPTSTVDPREARGRRLAQTAQIARVGRRWAVPSQVHAAERYLVDVEAATCTCPDFAQRKATCKHQHAVLFWIAWGRDVGATSEATTPVAKPRRKTYPQPWVAYNASQVYERDYVERLLRDLCAGIPQPPRGPGPGRNPILLRDATFATVMKVYSTLSSRRVQSDLRACVDRGHLDTPGHFNFVQVFLGRPSTTLLLESLIEQAAIPLRSIEDGRFAIDSTGFSTVYYDRWFDQRHGQLHAQHPWVKLHVMVGTTTHAITSARVTPEGDAPQLPGLLARTRAHHDVQELAADKAYASVANHAALDEVGVKPYIPFKDNAVINPKAPAWSRQLCEFLLHRERFLERYHVRSNVETVFSMMKARFGGAVLSRRPVAQVNEVLAKALAHNLCCLVKAIFVAGLAPAFWIDAPAVTPVAADLAPQEVSCP